MGDIPFPANERQIRRLIELQPQHVKTAWNNALKAARGGRVTARLVQAAASPFVAALAERPAGKKDKRTSNALDSKYICNLGALLKDAAALVNGATEALRMRTSPGEILAMHERALCKLAAAIELLQS